MSMLSDSEQNRLIEELYNTTTKIDRVLRRYGLDVIPSQVLAEVERLRKENESLHKKNGGMLKSIMSVFAFAGGEAKRHKD